MCTKPSGVLDSLIIYVVFKDFHMLKGSHIKGSMECISGPVFSKHLRVMLRVGHANTVLPQTWTRGPYEASEAAFSRTETFSS